jgi:phosphoenolpyruvate-protein kinase (PTS system EI component)
MQINSENNLISRLTAEGNPVRQGLKQPSKSDNNVPAALERGFGEILSKALTPADDQNLIEQVRKDLKEGRLESDSAFEQAAENILKYGL